MLRSAVDDDADLEATVAASLAALASGTDDDATVSKLSLIAWCWRLVTLRALLGMLDNRPHLCGPLDTIGDAWDLLSRAQAAAADRVNAIVGWPPVGTWAAYTIRRLSGKVDGEAPTWTDIGYLHSLAAAAATVAGLDFVLRIPVRRRHAIFPSLGSVTVAGGDEWDTARVEAAGRWIAVHCADSTVRLDRSGGTIQGQGWRSIPTIATASNGYVLQLALDDEDPFRNLRDPVRPHHITEAALARWSATVEAAWQLLVREHPRQAKMIAAGLVSIAPLSRDAPYRPASASSEQGFGTIVASEPDDAEQLAMTLVHEFDHNRLGVVLRSVHLHVGSGERALYSPWRDDPRPLGGLFQGIFAFVGITEFWRTQCRVTSGSETNELAYFEFGLWRQQVTHTLHMMRGLPALTEHGERFLDALIVRSRPWPDVRVPEHLRNLADIAADDHRATWLAYHRTPDRSLVHEIARAWNAEADCPVLETEPLESAPVIDNVNGRWLDSRAVLMRLALVEKFEPDTVWSCLDRVRGATEADVHYVAGRLDEAQDRYLESIATGPDDAHAWTGLRLTWPSAPDVLRKYPDLVCAAATAVAGGGPLTDPLRFTQWLNRGLRSR